MIEPGVLAAGDGVRVVDRPSHEVAVALCFRAPTAEPEPLPRLLDAEALPPGDLAAVRRRLG